MAEKITPNELSFVTEFPILKQKLSALLTDSIRCQGLKACGYEVTCLEFIDPEETPKNVMIKAIKSTGKSTEKMDEYISLCEKYNATPYFKEI